MPRRDGAELVPGWLRPRLFAALFQEREVSEEEKSRPALPAGVCARLKLAASPFPRAGMVESKALEVPQVRDALCFESRRAAPVLSAWLGGSGGGAFGFVPAVAGASRMLEPGLGLKSPPQVIATGVDLGASGFCS